MRSALDSDSIEQMMEPRSIAIGVLVIILGGLLARVFNLFTKEMDGSAQKPRPGVWIEANWGGLGGGLSGWRASNAVVYLVVLCLLLGCLSLAVVSLTPPAGKDTDKTGGQKTDAGTKDDKSGENKGAPNQSETKPADSSTGDQSPKKSPNSSEAAKKAEK